MTRLLFAVPHPDDLAIGMSIMSYAGEVSVTLNTAAAVVPTPKDFIDGFHADWRALQLTTSGEATPTERAEAPRKQAEEAPALSLNDV